MKTADRENQNGRDRLRNKPSPWGGRQEAPSLNQAGWKVRKFSAKGEVFFLTFPFIELTRTWHDGASRLEIIAHLWDANVPRRRCS
jgi:hypothetical protein